MPAYEGGQKYTRLSRSDEAFEGGSGNSNVDLDIRKYPHRNYIDLVPESSRCYDIDSLFHLVESSLTTTSVPPFYLRISIYRERTDHELHWKLFETDSSLLIASVLVPLASLPSQDRILFARADDSPCLRGGSPPFLFPKERNLADLSRAWSSSATGSPLGVITREQGDEEEEGSGHITTAKEEAILQWNVRCKRVACAPWLGLNVHPGNSMKPSFLSSTNSDNQGIGSSMQKWANKSSARLILDHFIQDNSIVKTLICPNVAFGWNTRIIEDHIVEGLKGQMYKSVAFKDPKPLSCVTVTVEAAEPALVVQVAKTNNLRDLFWLPPHRLRLILIGIGVLSTILFIWPVTVFVDIFNNKSDAMAVFLSSLYTGCYLSYFLILKLAFSDCRSVHEGIGLAWPLKVWQPTEFGSELTREEVRDRLPAEVSELCLDGNKWFAMYDGQGEESRERRGGGGEEMWWQTNQKLILDALRRSESGTLFPDELFCNNPVASSSSTSAE